MEHREELRAQNVKISNWIKDWQERNPYSDESGLKSHNEKFNLEFKEFLLNSGFEQSVINIYL